MLRSISQPWNGLDGSDGARCSSIARNYLRYGVFSLRFGQATNHEQVSDRSYLSYYQHHPPLPPLLTAGTFALLGESETAARLAPIVFSLGSILLVFSIARRAYDEHVALWSAFFFATFPGVLFFALMPMYEAPTIFFILLCMWFYQRILDEKGVLSLIGFFGSLGAGLLTDWPVYLFVPVLLLHSWRYGRSAGCRKILMFGIPVLAFCVFGVFQYQCYLVDPQSLTDLLNQGKVYMGLIGKESPLAAKYEESKVSFTAFQYGKTAASRLDLLFSYPLILLGALGIWATRKDRRAQGRLVFVLLGVALAYCVVFYRSVYIHVWHTYYLSAPLAIFGALGAREVFSRNRQSSGLSRCAAVLLVALTLTGLLPRLWSLHQIQIKVLPGDGHEQATFLKSVATEVRARSKPSDVILTNLTEMPGLRIALPYYAERKIVWGVDNSGKLSAFPEGMPRQREIRFLMWRAPEPAKKDDELYRQLVMAGRAEELVIEGHHFLWFTCDLQTLMRTANQPKVNALTVLIEPRVWVGDLGQSSTSCWQPK
jgi:hypothetical protein